MRSEHERACERVAGLFRSRWLRHYTSSKLRSDPVFRAAFELLKDSTKPLLDVGCGVGLLPLYLRERGWNSRVLGVDADVRKIQRGVAALTEKHHGIDLCEQDVRNELPTFLGNVALLDVLHYLAPADQQRLLVESAARVAPGGVLLLRDALCEPTLRFRLTHAAELFAQAISWNIGARLHFPTRESINAAFDEQEFTREQRPASGGMPFNNQLFVFRRRRAVGPPPG